MCASWTLTVREGKGKGKGKGKDDKDMEVVKSMEGVSMRVRRCESVSRCCLLANVQ
jgi:hypothetical protein